MCGIIGKVNRNASVDKNEFKKMCDTLSARGPDQNGYFFEQNIALGHRRLAILDLSLAGMQPMWTQDKTIGIVFNGEIYNFQSIREQLLTEQNWNSHSDTEVLLYAYQKWGRSFLSKLEGMFAFAIFDKNKQILLLARDHFGKKPIYYYLNDDTFCFASELKALLEDDAVRAQLEVDFLSLQKYLFYGYIPSPHTIFKHIKKLSAATFLEFDISKWKINAHETYWQLSQIAIQANLSEVNILEKIDDLLKESVKKRIISDVPLGIFLSGGVDSSLVASYLMQVMPNSLGYTMSYSSNKSIDESNYAARVANRLKLPIKLIQFDESSQVEKAFVDIFDYLDEPLADAAVVPLHFLAKAAKNDVTVILGGDGGDEVFGGYYKHKVQNLIEKLRWTQKLVKTLKPFVSTRSSYYKLFAAFDMQFPIRQFVFGSGGFLPNEVQKLLNSATLNIDDIFAEAVMHAEFFLQKSVINRSLYLDCKIQLPDWYLAKADRASMSASIEIRSPLLDKQLAEFAFSLPGELKIRGGVPKYLLKKLAERHIEKDIIYRAKKGFGVPLDKWIRSDLKMLFEHYLYQDSQYFNHNYINELMSQHLRGQDQQFKLLRLMGFNYFLSRYQLQ